MPLLRLLVQSTALALTVLACAPPRPLVVVDPEPRPRFEPEPPAPETETEAESESWKLEPVVVQLPDGYVRKQGERVSGIATPWAAATARVLGIDASGRR